jgi:dipeptidyl aminopeptidase/acylaminoacyl peptidase
VRAAVAWLRATPGVDRRRIALLGHSEGALIAPMIAAQDTTIAALVLMAGPAWTGRRIIAYQNGKAIDRQGAVAPPRRDSLLAVAMRAVDSSAVSTPWLRFFLDYDPIPTARRVRAPVLVLQGATDQQVDPAQASELAAALRAGRARAVSVRTFPETNHLFVSDPLGDPARYSALADTHVRREVLGAVAEWLATTLGAR